MKMNKKEREQLLRDTLDQCLSGLDSLPSDRAEVNRRLAENAPEITHRIRFRRLAVPAVALVLCACLVITGTHLGLIPWPDRIRPQEARITVAPVALAQPAGEGTENPESPAGEGLVPFSSLPAEVREETENLFAGFFNAWKTGNINTMLELCSPAWVSAREDPKLALFSILQNRTPSDFIIESISGTSGDTERMVSTVVTMNYNNNKPETDFRMHVQMVLEDNCWYVNPDSLVSYKKITTPEPEAAPSPAPKAGTEPNPDFIALLQETIPDCPAGFVPVGLSCEKEGFRLEVVYASVNEQSAFLIYSLQDLEGKHSDLNHDDVLLHGSYPWPYRLVNSSSLQYDDSSRTLWFAAEYQADTAYDPGEVLIDGLPRYLAAMTSLCFIHSENLAIGGLFEKYRDRAALVDVPKLITTHRLDNDGNTLVYDTSWYRERGIRVLDYTHPLSVRLHEHLELSGVGLIDGQLHVQLHYVDNSPVINGSVYYNPVVDAKAYIPSEPAADSIPEIPAMLWDTDGDGLADYIEYVYPCESEEEARKLKVSFLEITGAVEGNWIIEIPLETVWTGDPDANFLKPQVPEDIESWITEFFGAWELGEYDCMLDYCSPSWVSAQENPRQALFGNILMNRTPSSVSVESVSGSNANTERMVTVLASMDYHNNKPDVEIRLNVRIVREDGAWYVDPNSLVSYKKITTPEPMAETKTDPVDVLRALRPDCISDFVPVGLSCEKDGFRLELVSASVNEQLAFLIFSLQDLEGDRLTSETDPLIELPESLTGQHLEAYKLNLLYDEASRKRTFAMEYRYDSPDVLHNGTQQVTAVLPELYIIKSNQQPLGEFLGKYGDRASLVDVPQLIPISFSDIDGTTREYGTSWYRDRGIQVLDYTHPLSVRLHGNLELSGIGLIDGLLHVQLHYVDNMMLKSDGSVLHTHIPAAHVSSPCEPFPDPVNVMQWDSDSDGQADFIEYVYSCQTEAEAAKDLNVFSMEILDWFEGPWTIEVPLETVWTGGYTPIKGDIPAYIEIPSRLGGFFHAWSENDLTTMMEFCSPAWVSAQNDPKAALINILQNRAPSSCTVESMAGLPGETGRRVTVTVSMDYNNKPEVPVRMTVRMLHEEYTWYIDPESLVSYKVITTPEPEAEPSPGSEPEPDPEAALSASEFLPDESPVDVSKRISGTQLLSLRPDLQDQLFPVNLYWTDGTIRLKVVSAAVGETESWIIYVLENGSLTDYSYLTNILDDSPLSGPDITEHYELGLIPAKSTKYYAARIRHSQPDPERKAVVFSVSDIENMVYSSIDDMKSLLISYEGLSGDLVDLPDSTMFISTVDGKDISPKEFRESGLKILDSTHSPHVFLANGLELSGIRLEENGMLHIQVHCRMTPDESGDGMARKPVHFWYFSHDIEALDRTIYRILLQDPAESAAYYSEYILPWTMEDFDNLKLSIELLELGYSFPGPLTLEISRPE